MRDTTLVGAMIGEAGPAGTTAALHHTAERVATMLKRGPYPRIPLPDEVWCLDCAVVMPVALQVAHRAIYGHEDWEWAGAPKVPTFTIYENVPSATASAEAKDV